MRWFSLWVPLVLQLVVPLSLVGWVAAARGARVVRIAVAGVTALYLMAIGLAGLWLVLPWWLPFVYVIALLAAARGGHRARPQVPPTTAARLALVALGLGGLLLSVIILLVLVARRPPSDAVELAFPLQDGTYLVVNGGNHQVINAHLATLEGDRFRPYRGQSHGVDIVRIDRLGLRARGLLPGDPRAYLAFGATVGAPCDGRVVVAVDGVPDMRPPQPDRSHMAGNHVILDCAGIWVVLGHLERGSVAVRQGDPVRIGASLGSVGNSGNTGEPHLHIHAQRPGSDAEPMSGDPLPVLLGGRYLARNSRVTVTSGVGSVHPPSAADHVARVSIADNRDVVNRRDFLGGAVCGSAAAVGVAATRAWTAPPPLPPSPPPPQPRPLPEHARLSFSQQGEDIVLFHVMHEMLKIASPTYLDVGAAYPVRGNNTYLLYTTGARGVLVEPNPALAAQLRHKRPGDTVVEAGIGVDDVAEADYYQIKGNAMLNTFSADTVAHLQRGKTESVVERVVKMPLLNINGVIADHLGRAPDLLSTDVEGLDEAIIRTLDLSRFRPGAICAEAVPTTKAGRPSRLTSYLGSRGYIPRGGSMYNTVYVDARRL